MAMFRAKTDNIEDLMALSCCRLFLHAYHISDLTDGSRKMITHDAWTGICVQHKHRATSWPQQAKPPVKEWYLWKKYLKICLLNHGLHLRQPLGQWNEMPTDWSWFFSPAEECLYQIYDNTQLRHSRTPAHTPLLHFQPIGVPCDKPMNILPATVYSKGNSIVWSSHGAVNEMPSVTNLSLQEFLSSFGDDKWCTQDLVISPDSCDNIALTITNGTAIAVSDGSFKSGDGSAVFIIEGTTQNHQIKGCVIAPGGKDTQSAYRSELSGILATLVVTNKI
jgi:hypothetical protein